MTSHKQTTSNVYSQWYRRSELVMWRSIVFCGCVWLLSWIRKIEVALHDFAQTTSNVFSQRYSSLAPPVLCGRLRQTRTKRQTERITVATSGKTTNRFRNLCHIYRVVHHSYIFCSYQKSVITRMFAISESICSIYAPVNVLFLQYWIGSAVFHLCCLS